MRPTDENQSPSMRPNLMSPRRVATSGEDSILAMLEREPARKRGATAPNPRLAWYGAGALMALGLTGALVWLAANNDGLRPDVPDSVLADAAKASQPAPAAPALIQVAMAPAAPPVEQRAPNAAVIVDQPPAADAVPPLRLLKPAPDKAADPVRVPVPAAVPSRPAARITPPPRPVAATPVEAKATPPSPRPKPVLVAKSAAKPAAPKAPRSAPPAARNGEPAVDADVALISAVIVHANGHAPQNSQMTELLCPNDNCQPRPPRQ